jgi:hypothetical protein
VAAAEEGPTAAATEEVEVCVSLALGKACQGSGRFFGSGGAWPDRALPLLSGVGSCSADEHAAAVVTLVIGADGGAVVGGGSRVDGGDCSAAASHGKRCFRSGAETMLVIEAPAVAILAVWVMRRDIGRASYFFPVCFVLSEESRRW